MSWSHTVIKHPIRIKMGLSVLEYCVLDYIYKTQTSPKYSQNGWCKTSYQTIADFFGITKRGAIKICKKSEQNKLLILHSDGRKKTTKNWFEQAYEDIKKEEKEPVNKVHHKETAGEQSTRSPVNKVHQNSEKSVNKVPHKYNIENIKENIKEKEVFKSIPNLKKEIGANQYKALNEVAKDETKYNTLRSFWNDGKFDLLIKLLTHRKEIKQTATKTAIVQTINKFTEFYPQELEAALKNAIECGYRTIFPKEDYKLRKELNQQCENNLNQIFGPPQIARA